VVFVTSRAVFLAAALAAAAGPAAGQPVAVRHEEGLVHGFLALSTVEGKTIADGDLIQTSSGNRVTSRLVFRFRDGSTYDETSVFTQQKRFRLVRNDVVTKGPTFPRPVTSSIDMKTGQVTVRYTEDGKDNTHSEKMELPDDLANGLILTLLKNISPETPKTVVSMLAITPKPRMVKLEFTPDGKESFSTGGTGREATRYRVKVDIPGVIGVMASVLDKTPPDSFVWILGGDAPAFIMSLSPMYVEGPLWRIELVSPTWPKKGL
jgi:hypothetical protein